MTKVNHRISKGVVGVAFILIFMLITLIYSTIGNWPSVNAASNQISAQKTNGGEEEKEKKKKKKEKEKEKDKEKEEENGKVNGTAEFILDGEKQALTVVLNLKNVPSGVHAAHLHQGSCPLQFADIEKGPFDPAGNLTLKVINSKNGSVKSKQTIKAAVLEKAKIQASDLVGGGWFLCIHSGALKELGKVPGKTPEEKFANLQKALGDKKQGPALKKQINQLVCEPVKEGEIAIDISDNAPAPDAFH